MTEDIQVKGGLILPKTIGWTALAFLGGALIHAVVLETRVSAVEKTVKSDHESTQRMEKAMCGICIKIIGSDDPRCIGVCQ